MKIDLTLTTLCFAMTACGGSAATNDAGASVDSGTTDAAAAAGEDAPGASCWQLDTIPDIRGSSWGNAGGSYAAPTLSASCDDTHLVVHSNGIPTFTFVPITPNDLGTQAYTWNIPRSPARAATTTDVPLLGPAAITVTGLPIYGPTENPMDDYRDPYLDDAIANLLDECNGHTAPRGVYHFHARPECLVVSLGGARAGLVIGFAFDGYPILVPLACDDASCTATHELSSSWRLTIDEYTTATRGPAWDIHEFVEGLGELDECNGMAITTPGSPYDYAYFATDTFPYFLGCYRGTPEIPRTGP
jgi:hypothetical protein